MGIDLAAADAFMTAHARLLDRRRFALRFGGGDPDAALAALDAYRNADGGYGWGLEPDLRAGESQPGGALHAFEVFAEVAPIVTPRAGELCDWLASASLPDGGLPFALPVASTAGVAPFWAQADPTASSLHITAAVAAAAHAVARHDRAVADHPWLAGATRFCLDAIAALERPGGTLELMYALALLDAIAESDAPPPDASQLDASQQPDAAPPDAGVAAMELDASQPDAAPLDAGVAATAELERLAGWIPADGVLGVPGGAEGEAIRALDFAPRPGRPLRERIAPAAVELDLDRLAAGQRPDGGWDVDFDAYSPAAALEWRGYETQHALSVLQDNGRLSPAAAARRGTGRGPAAARA